jgi:hypothetical protein
MTRRLVLPVLLLLAISACGETDTKLKVTGIEPEKGDVDGGTYVRLKGNRFTADGPRNVKVYFGKDSSMRQGTVVRFASDSELIVEAPGGKPNEKVDVLIIFDPGGQLKIKDGFTFVEKNDAPANVNDLDTSKPKK